MTLKLTALKDGVEVEYPSGRKVCVYFLSEDGIHIDSTHPVNGIAFTQAGKSCILEIDERFDSITRTSGDSD